MTPPTRHDGSTVLPLTQTSPASTLRQRNCQHHPGSMNAFYQARGVLERMGVDVLAEEGRVGDAYPLPTRQRVSETGAFAFPPACEDTRSRASRGAFNA